MKNGLKMLWSILFLAIFLPYTAILLMNGRQGVSREEKLPDREYQVLAGLLQEDLSWMDEETLCLMAVLIRTELVRTGTSVMEEPQVRQTAYEAACDAVKKTCGKVITIDGEYRALPWHGISAGRTRAGILLGEEYSYIHAVECQEDRESEDYLRVFRMDRKTFLQILQGENTAHQEWEKPELERDSSDYVTRVRLGDEMLQGESVRTLLHLPSSCFYVDDSEEILRITVKGNGHGFGISLYTADRMIREGMCWEEVIQKFYENAECITLF